MKLIIVRHGETFANVSRITQGQLNTQLSLVGIKQAMLVGKRLMGDHIDVAYSSDLDRAYDTCSEIVRYHPSVKLISTKVLREQRKGFFEGSIHLKNSITNYYTENYHLWKPYSGESLIQVWDRTVKFTRELEKKHMKDTVLIVTHGGPISCMLAHYDSKDVSYFRDYLPKNTSVSNVSVNPHGASITMLNCIRHLG